MRVTNESGLDDWCDELKAALVKSNSIAVAIISHQGELLFSNSLFDSLVHGDVKHQFINPTFDQLAARITSYNVCYTKLLRQLNV